MNDWNDWNEWMNVIDGKIYLWENQWIDLWKNNSESVWNQYENMSGQLYCFCFECLLLVF